MEISPNAAVEPAVTFSIMPERSFTSYPVIVMLPRVPTAPEVISLAIVERLSEE